MRLATTGILALAALVTASNPVDVGRYEAGASTTAAHHTKQTYHVDVGTFDGKFQFVPNYVDAKIDDIILFNFLGKSHSLTQSNFATPCTYNGGFDTGLNQLNLKNQSGLFVVPLIVTTQEPQWFYCQQLGPPNHCSKGMVFGLNPAGKMDQFIKNAIAQNEGLDGPPTITCATATCTTATRTTATQRPCTYSSAPNGIQTVTVGLDGGKTLRFDPPFLRNVQRGSTVHFDFRALDHTLTESTLDAPCTKLEGSTVDINFGNANPMDISDFKPFDFTFDSDRPRFFYCKQASSTPNSHCGKGMVFAVNVDEERFAQFQAAAEATLPKIRGRSPRP